MKRSSVLRACVAFSVVMTGGMAAAADLGTKPIFAPPAPVLPQHYDWSGFYIGGNVGYGWATTDSTAYSVATGKALQSASNDRKGILGGGQVGFNYMVAPQWLLGVEGDFSGANLTNSSDTCGPVRCYHVDRDTDWFATARGRFGYVWDNVLFYGTGGAIWVNNKSDVTLTSGPVGPFGLAQSRDITTLGWTAGGGLEWGFAPHWSAKFEYLFYQVQPEVTVTTSSPAADRRFDATQNGNIARVGINYHF